MLTKDQAKLIMQAHDILTLLDDVEELFALEANNPKLADAYCALHRVAFGADPTEARHDAAEFAEAERQIQTGGF